MPAVQNGDGQKIHHRQIRAQHRQKEQEAAETLLRRLAGLFGDLDRPAEQPGADLVARELVQKLVDERQVVCRLAEAVPERGEKGTGPHQPRERLEEQPAVDHEVILHGRRFDRHVALRAIRRLHDEIEPRAGIDLLQRRDHVGPARRSLRKIEAGVGIPFFFGLLLLRRHEHHPRHPLARLDACTVGRTSGVDCGDERIDADRQAQ